MTIEARITATQTSAQEIAVVLETELTRRIIYLERARLLIGLARDAREVMRRTEAAGVESDFNEGWHTLRGRLAESQKQFERIIAGSDASPKPCRAQSQI